jgi:hypothetical protein
MNQDSRQIFQGAFRSPDDGHLGLGIRPVVFDVLATDLETSLLPGDMKLVLHVNPTTMKFSYTKQIERIQTKGGYVEQHWGEGPGTMSLEMATGGFMRLYSGLSNITGGPFAMDLGGTRRETIAYDKYLDMLALFHSNGSVYDTEGNIVFQGIIKVIFDEGVHLGWFNSFSVSESSQKPYQFDLSGEFQVHRELMSFKTTVMPVESPSRFDNPDPSKVPGAVYVSTEKVIIPEAEVGGEKITKPKGYKTSSSSNQNKGKKKMEKSKKMKKSIDDKKANIYVPKT